MSCNALLAPRREALEWPLRRAAVFERLGLAAAGGAGSTGCERGVLLFGPSGCSKV